MRAPSRLLQTCLALLALPLLMACGGEREDGGDRLRVVATTTQIGDFATNVGGDLIELTVLFSANQDAHDFAPTPSQIRALSEADLVLRNGVGLDTFANRVLETAGTAAVVVVTADVELRAGSHEHEGEESTDAEAAGRDPHVWFDVANVKIMSAAIETAVADADPANAEAYAANAAAYQALLDDLDAAIRSEVATVPAACRKLVTDHEVLSYYSEAYGFELVGSVIPSLSTEAQPSASDVAQIVQQIRDAGVPAIFAEAAENDALIRQVAREADVELVGDLYGDSLGPADSDGATYIEMMEANTTRIVEALRDCPE